MEFNSLYDFVLNLELELMRFCNFPGFRARTEEHKHRYIQ